MKERLNGFGGTTLYFHASDLFIHAVCSLLPLNLLLSAVRKPGEPKGSSWETPAGRFWFCTRPLGDGHR